MANRNSLIELLEDLTTGKDYEHCNKNLKSEYGRSNQDKKPKVYEYDHTFSISKPENFNQRSTIPKPNDYGSNFSTQRINNDYFVPNKVYPPPSWPQNFDPLNFHSPSGQRPVGNNPNVVDFGHFNQPSAMGQNQVQLPFNAHLDRKLNCAPFSPNSDKSIIPPQVVPYGAGFNAGLQFHNFNANIVRPPYPIDIQSGTPDDSNGISNKPITAPNQYFQNSYHNYAHKAHVTNSFTNNSPGTNYGEINSACNPNSSANLNLIPPPPPPTFLKNFNTINNFSESVKINSNSFRGPRTPPLSHHNSSSSERVYSSKGPRTPPMKGKGPNTPPQKRSSNPPKKRSSSPPKKGTYIPPKIGPRTPLKKEHGTPLKKGPSTHPKEGPSTYPKKGPSTPPKIGPSTPPKIGPSTPPKIGRGTITQKDPHTLLKKGPHTPPFKGPHTPPFKGPRTPPINSPPIPSKGPHTPPISPFATLSPCDFSEPQTHPPLPSYPILSKPPLPSNHADSNDFKLKTPEPPKSQCQKIKIIRRSSQELSSSDSDSSDKPDTCYPDYIRKIQDSPESFKKDISPTNSDCRENLVGKFDAMVEKPLLKGRCSNYFYGSSFFNGESADDSHKENESKIEATIRKKVKHKVKDKPVKDSINLNVESKDLNKTKKKNDCLKLVSENNSSGLQRLDSSDDKDCISDDSSCSENSNDSGSHSPFIKYSDYEELLNLEAKWLTMEQGDKVTDLNEVNESNSLVEPLENGSPILYDLPDDSPPPFSPTALSSSHSPMPQFIEESEKPKYPMYFKDKVAFSSSFQPPFNETHLHSPEQDYNSKTGTPDLLPHKEFPKFDDIENYNKILVHKNYVKVAKTPLIKRLGLVEDSSSNAAEETTAKLTPVTQNKSKAINETPIADRIIQLSTAPSNNVCVQNNEITEETPKSVKETLKSIQETPKSVKETLKPVRKLVIVENQEGKLTKVKLASPTFPEKTTPAIMKPRESKEFLQTSYKSKTMLRTPKGRRHIQKMSEKSYVKASPMRLDLDSRIKILFGTKSDSPQKSSNVDSPPKYHYKNYPPLSRPPSPFRNRNLYLYWHRETYYFRKHNPNPPPGSVDPMLRRKIGIQISHQSSLPLETKPSCATNLKELEKGEPTDKLNLSPKLCLLENPKNDASLDECQVTSCSNIAISTLKTTPVPDICSLPPEITRIDVPPNNELEIVSEPSEINISESNKQILENSDKKSNMIEMVLNKILDSLKESLKRKLTDSIVNDDELWDNFRPVKISKSD